MHWLSGRQTLAVCLPLFHYQAIKDGFFLLQRDNDSNLIHTHNSILVRTLPGLLPWSLTLNRIPNLALKA